MNKYIPQEEKFSLQKNNGQFFLAVLCNASDKAISMKFFRNTPMKQIAGSVSPKTPPFPEKGWELATMKQCNMFLFNELRKRTWGFVLNKPLPCRFSSKKML
jgi:hypothetical protein